MFSDYFQTIFRVFSDYFQSVFRMFTDHSHYTTATSLDAVHKESGSAVLKWNRLKEKEEDGRKKGRTKRKKDNKKES